MRPGASYGRAQRLTPESKLTMRLLLVEDHLPIQRFVERALVEAGYRVDATADAKSAEALALEGIHDAFIMDSI